MKILYAVQATGNGHISRAMEILPYLQKYGQVDIFLSGSNNTLQLNAPVKYRSKGLSFFYSTSGSINYPKTISNFSPYRIYKEIKELPVEKYDLVLNDFESLTALACAYKKVPSVNFGHQASFISSNTPRPASKELMGEFILKNYARASKYIGLHFDTYDDFILTPVIKDEIWNAQPTNQNHITVYLSAYSDKQLLKFIAPIKDYQFQVFSREVKTKMQLGNITLLPVDKTLFNQSLVNCTGIITGAGFETPAEALYLNKKIMATPIKGQYEQKCNAAALEKLGVKILNDLDAEFVNHFNSWMNTNLQTNVHYNKSAKQIVDNAMQMCSQRTAVIDFGYKDLVWN